MSKKLHVLIVCQTLSPVIDSITGSGHSIAGIVQSASFSGQNDPSLRQFAAENKIPFMLLDRTTRPLLARWVAHTRADIGVVHSMSQLLKADVLSVPRYGFINMHPSFLPAWRGADPLFWQFYHGDHRIGVTWHAVDEGEDTGAILAQAEIRTAPPEGYRAIARKQAQEGAALLPGILEMVAAGRMAGQVQPAISPTPRAPRVHINMLRCENRFEFTAWPAARARAFIQGVQDKHYIFSRLPLFFGCAWQVAPEAHALLRRTVTCMDGALALKLVFSPRYAWRMLRK